MAPSYASKDHFRPRDRGDMYYLGINNAVIYIPFLGIRFHGKLASFARLFYYRIQFNSFYSVPCFRSKIFLVLYRVYLFLWLRCSCLIGDF